MELLYPCFLVLGILTQILLLGDTIIDKTGFKLKAHPHTQKHKGHIKVNGHIRGNVSGMVDAKINGTILGTIDAKIETDAIKNINSNLKEKKEVQQNEKTTENI